MNKMTLSDVSVKGKKVLCRVDFNVPLDENLNITSDNRIKAALPTIKKIIDDGGKLILASHMGRPKGKVVAEFSLKPAAVRLSELLGKEVKLAPDSVGVEVEKMVSEMNEGDVVLLENLRFHKEETDGDKEFAKKIANLADIYVNDAFGAAHRAHASVSVLTEFFETSVAGYLMEKEIEYIGKTIASPERPFAAILAGVKIAGKIDVIMNLLDKADKIFIGGGIANTILLAQGYEIGNSIVEEDKVDVAKEILEKAKAKNVKLFLPVDMLCGKEFNNDTERKYVDFDKQEKGWIAMGVGPKTVEMYKKELSECKTLVWNGPVSVFEFDNFAKETIEIAQIVADLTSEGKLKSVVGGGDTAAAVKKAGVSDKMSHISTGGGASLEFMEGKELPGIVCLTDK